MTVVPESVIPNPAVSPDLTKKEPLWSIDILRIFEESRRIYGIGQNDFDNYRKYCGNRLKRIRKNLNLTNGNKSGYRPKKLSAETATDSRILLIHLMCAERTWASAMESRLQSVERPCKRSHSIRKLKKAIMLGRKMLELAETSHFDSRTVLQVQCYCVLLESTLHIEIKKWRSALDDLTKVKSIYKAVKDIFSEDNLESLYENRINEIAINERFCNYNVGVFSDDSQFHKPDTQEEPVTEDKEPELISSPVSTDETPADQNQFLMPIKWGGITFHARDDSSKALLINLSTKKETLLKLWKTLPSKEKLSGVVELYDDLLRECREILAELHQKSHKGSSLNDDEYNSSDSKPNQIHHQMTQLYLSFLKSLLNVERTYFFLRVLSSYPESFSDVSRGITSKTKTAARKAQPRGAGGKASSHGSSSSKTSYKSEDKSASKLSSVTDPIGSIRLVTSILESLSEILELSVSNKSEMNNFFSKIECLKSYFCALRCYYSSFLSDSNVNKQFCRLHLCYKHIDSFHQTSLLPFDGVQENDMLDEKIKILHLESTEFLKRVDSKKLSVDQLILMGCLDTPKVDENQNRLLYTCEDNDLSIYNTEIVDNIRFIKTFPPIDPLSCGAMDVDIFSKGKLLQWQYLDPSEVERFASIKSNLSSETSVPIEADLTSSPVESQENVKDASSSTSTQDSEQPLSQDSEQAAVSGLTGMVKKWFWG